MTDHLRPPDPEDRAPLTGEQFVEMLELSAACNLWLARMTDAAGTMLGANQVPYAPEHSNMVKGAAAVAEKYAECARAGLAANPDS